MLRTTCLALALLAPLAASAVPLQFTHQGRLLDASGAPLDGSHSITIALYASESDASALWSETHAAELDQGFFSLVLGSSTALDSSAFDGSTLYVGIAVDGGAELSGRLPLTSVPYALSAGNATTAGTATNVSGGAVDATEIKVNGTTVVDGSGAFSGTVDWSRLTNVPPAGADTLSELSCVDGDVPWYDGSSWSCGPVELDASALVSGTIDISRVPVGTSGTTVAAGDHTHDAASLVSGTIDPDRLPPSSVADGSDKDHAAYSCKAVQGVDPRAKSGEFWLDAKGDGTAIKAWCDMETEGGGWLDLVKTFHIVGADAKDLGARFFVANKTGVTLTFSAAESASKVKGILIQYTGAPSHETGFHLKPADLTYTSVRTFWRIQGSDENYRCSSGNWIPLNGPGYNGGSGSYASPCPTGYTCLQGTCENGRDAPVNASYNIDAMTSANTLLTWSGSNTGPLSLNCSRDPEIPLDKPAAFISKMLIR